MNQIRVLVGVPTMGAMQPNLVSVLLRWAREFEGDQISFYFSDHVAPVDRARNQIVKFFLESEAKFTHLLFVDSDTLPQPDALRRLLSHKLPVVSGLTPILSLNKATRTWETFDNCFRQRVSDTDGNVTTHIAERHTGLQEIFRCGSSCILIKREVFEALKPPYYDFQYNEDHTEHRRSEDIGFCDKARDAGFKLYADTDVICMHHKEAVI